MAEPLYGRDPLAVALLARLARAPDGPGRTALELAAAIGADVARVRPALGNLARWKLVAAEPGSDPKRYRAVPGASAADLRRAIAGRLLARRDRDAGSKRAQHRAPPPVLPAPKPPEPAPPRALKPGDLLVGLTQEDLEWHAYWRERWDARSQRAGRP